jgi:hypothetical protein
MIDRAKVRPVADAATRRRLGFVTRQSGGGGPLLGWLAGGALLVYETEDASLLCSVHRTWSFARRWEVCEADGRRVALVYRALLVDALGYPLAEVEPPAGAHAGRFVGRRCQELGNFRPDGLGTSLAFAAELDNDPFARMALLGAVLAYEW